MLSFIGRVFAINWLMAASYRLGRGESTQGRLASAEEAVRTEGISSHDVGRSIGVWAGVGGIEREVTLKSFL